MLLKKKKESSRGVAEAEEKLEKVREDAKKSLLSRVE
jgi:hypothetical protein